MTTITVDLNVPLPADGRGRHLKNPEMREAMDTLFSAPVGASIVVTRAQRSSAISAARRLGEDWFKIAKSEGGFRVWKLK